MLASKRVPQSLLSSIATKHHPLPRSIIIPQHHHHHAQQQHLNLFTTETLRSQSTTFTFRNNNNKQRTHNNKNSENNEKENQYEDQFPSSSSNNNNHGNKLNDNHSNNNNNNNGMKKQEPPKYYCSRAKLPIHMKNVFEIPSESMIEQIEKKLLVHPPSTINTLHPSIDELVLQEEEEKAAAAASAATQREKWENSQNSQIDSSSHSSSISSMIAAFDQSQLTRAFHQQMTKIISLIQPSTPNEIKIGIAVSGGVDSMALALLLSQWKKSLPSSTPFSVSIVAITVNHGKRPESELEVVQVKKWMKEKCGGIPTAIYNVKWLPDEKMNQETCREKRLSCLADAKSKYDLDVILLGHHLDDQVEIFLYRMALGSGLQGLSGLSDVTHLIGCDFGRPLQKFRKMDLILYCRAHDVQWLNDPTNFDAHEFRGSVRHCLPKWENHNITHDEITHAMHSIRYLVKIMNYTIGEFILTNVKFDRNLGCVAVNLNGLLTLLPKAHAITLIGALSQYVSNKKYVSKTASLEVVYNFIKKAQHNRDTENTMTCGLCIFVVKSNTIYIAREPTPTNKRATVPLHYDETVLFDNRYKVTVSRKQYFRTRYYERGAIFDFWQNIEPVGFEEDVHSYKDTDDIVGAPSAHQQQQQQQQEQNSMSSSASANDPQSASSPPPLRVRGFRRKDWQVIARSLWGKTRYNTPWFLRYGIPVIEDAEGRIVAIPLLGYKTDKNFFWKCELISDTNIIQKFVAQAIKHKQQPQ